MEVRISEARQEAISDEARKSSGALFVDVGFRV